MFTGQIPLVENWSHCAIMVEKKCLWIIYFPFPIPPSKDDTTFSTSLLLEEDPSPVLLQSPTWKF